MIAIRYLLSKGAGNGPGRKDKGGSAASKNGPGSKNTGPAGKGPKKGDK